MEEEADEDITDENEEDTKANNDPSKDPLDKAAEDMDIKNGDTSVETNETAASEEIKEELITKDPTVGEASDVKKEDLDIEKKEDPDGEAIFNFL